MSRELTRPNQLLFSVILLSAFTLNGCDRKEEAKSTTSVDKTKTETAAPIITSSPQKVASPGNTQLFWGDTHLHTNYSGDAYALLTTTADPDTSYRFAKGLPVVADLNRSRVQIETPLDFLVVTDHAEFIGVLPEIAKGNELLLDTKFGPSWKKKLEEGRGGEVLHYLLFL